MTFAQFLRHIGANATAPVAELIVGIEQCADIKIIAQAFAQHTVVIAFLLKSFGGCGRVVQFGTRLGCQRFDRADRALEQVFFGLGAAFSRCFFGGPGGC